MLSVNTRARRALAALTTTFATLAAGTLVAAPASAAPAETRTATVTASSTDDGPSARKSRRAGFRIASLNLPHTMSASGVKHDIRLVMSQGRPSVIGFQERGGSRKAMRAALPRHWALVMPPSASGAGLNPVAFDTRVWRKKDSWAKLLTDRTWRRGGSGKMAINQYGVVVQLVHRQSRHTVRLINFHMPPDVHDKRTGGPNWRYPDRVRAFKRMAASVREVAAATTEDHFLITCDCNVKASRDVTDKLVRGRISRPLDLTTNYHRGKAPVPFEADYVMGREGHGFPLVDWRQLNDGLITDHPSPVARFRETAGHFRERTS